MRIPFRTPSDQVLRAVAATLRAFDWISAGCEAAPTIRHAKRRFSRPDEYPCVTVRWEQDEPRADSQDDNYITPDEEYVEMRLTIEIETQPFDGEGGDTAPIDDDDDETGLGFSSALAFLCLRALKDPDGLLLSQWAAGVSDRGRGEDPDSTNDEARLEQTVIVLYRVSTGDPSVILAPGVNL
jgi:hypothetical protein